MRTVVVILAVVVVIGLGTFTALRGWNGLAADKPLTEAEILARGREGMPVVSAIYAYKQENGLWPRRLDDLAPRFIPATQLRGWNYQWHYWGRWSVAKWLEPGEARVKYEYEPPTPGWVIDFGEEERPLKLDQPLPATRPADPAEIARKVEAEFLRRTTDEPGEADHWQCLISFYVRAGRLGEARQAYGRFAAGQAKPPALGSALLAYIDFKEGHADEGERRLRDMTGVTPFAQHVFLFNYFQWTDQRPKAIAEVQAIADLNLFGDVANHTPDGFLYDAGRYAYRAKQYALVVKVSDAYERLEKRKGYSEGSYHAMRACAQLALGEFDKALPNCELAIQRNARQRTWAGDLEGLKAAIVRKDAAYAYQGWNDYPGPLEVPVNYE